MPARSSSGVVYLALAACSAGHSGVDPGDLELRDLLGIAPEVAGAWNAAERAAARRVLELGLRDGDAPARRWLAATPQDLDARVARLLATDDAARAASGMAPLGVVRIALDGAEIAIVAPRPAPRAAAQLAGDTPAAARAGTAPAAPHDRRAAPELWLAEPWNASAVSGGLWAGSTALLAALAGDADHGDGPLIVVPAPRLTVIAAYVRPGDTALPRLAINPVVLAALEPTAGEAEAPRGSPPTVVAHAAPGAVPGARGAPVMRAAGNPYSFYGSVAECAAAQRRRCDACTPTSSCQPITNITDGNAECAMLGAGDGRGYFLLCVNLALAITSIDRCTADAAPGCVRDPRAADTLATLENNAVFLADPTCGGALDGCLARVFGPPHASFPGLDGGTASEPPRTTSVSCGQSCDQTQNTRCDASPSCDCSGPSCNNSLSCDSTCASSNDQHGCSGNCDACTPAGGDDAAGGGCSGGSSSSRGGDGCSGCSGNDSGGSCGGGCSSSGSGCSSSGSGCGSSSGCGSGGTGKCSAAAIDPAPGLGAMMSALWASLPVVLSALAGRRARRRHPGGSPRRARASTTCVASPSATDQDAR